MEIVSVSCCNVRKDQRTSAAYQSKRLLHLPSLSLHLGQSNCTNTKSRDGKVILPPGGAEQSDSTQNPTCDLSDLSISSDKALPGMAHRRAASVFQFLEEVTVKD